MMEVGLSPTALKGSVSMDTAILHPEILFIRDAQQQRTFFGGDQEWYAAAWARQAGCGATCAANLLLYLASTRPGLGALYPYDAHEIADFSRHMEDVFPFLQPGAMGLNRLEMFTDGVVAFAKERGIRLVPHLFHVPGWLSGGRPSLAAFRDFVREGLEADCPIGFLNLTRGRVKDIQAWHWITLTGASTGGDCLRAWASDEGKEICFDLKLWYLSTRLRGGLAYFTED